MYELEDNKAWQIVSSILGWSYFLAWSCSFYPQAFLNWRRKSVQGLSIDFLYYNIVGFFCYSIFNLSFFYSKQIQEEYKQRKHTGDNLVRGNDVLFSVHAFLISLFTLFQTFCYKRDDTQQVSTAAQTLLSVAITGGFATLLAVYAGFAQLIDFMYYLSYVKLGVSLVKYIPQIWLNYKKRSTVGWSIHNILLDCTGGLLSIIQLFLDAFLSNDWSGISGDPVKLALGLQSILFDFIFMFQHYVLYRDRTDVYIRSVDEERRRLIAEGRVPRTDEEIAHYNYNN